MQVLNEARTRFPVLPEGPEVLDRWLEIVTAYDLKGKRIHDAHLLATLIANAVPALLTANPKDFPLVPNIALLTPESLFVS